MKLLTKNQFLVKKDNLERNEEVTSRRGEKARIEFESRQTNAPPTAHETSRNQGQKEYRIDQRINPQCCWE
uniref:Uncharacterized protein n=1 Tax=Heterorhabditis bacteriophora TaxID=37862 RepID=A0A1I7XEX0_HETBA